MLVLSKAFSICFGSPFSLTEGATIIESFLRLLRTL